MIRRCTLAAIGLALLPAVAAADDLPFRERGGLAIQARAILRKYCIECHGDAPKRGTLSVTDYKNLTTKDAPVRFVNLLDPKGRSQIIEFLEDGSMPPGGRDRPTGPEIATLKRWVAASAPSYPRAFDDRATLAAMLADFKQQPPEDQPFLRYVSLAHLVPDGQEPPDLAPFDQRLQKALLLASGTRVSPDPVDATATLFRLDLRKLGWDARDLFLRVEGGKDAGVHPTMIPFDLVLLEYPFGFTLPPGDPQAADLQLFFKATKQLRPVPFLRGDWLADALLDPDKPTVGRPLAEELKALVELSGAWAKRKKDDDLMPCGPVPRPFLGGKLLKPDPPPDGTLPVAPLGAWYAGDVTPEREPFTLKAEMISPKRKEPFVFGREEFYIRMSADRNVRFVLLNVLPTGDVRLPRVAGGNLYTVDKKLKPLGPDPGMGYTAGLPLTREKSEIDHWLLIAAEADADLPLPTIVRSRHDETSECRKENRRAIWRFVFDGDKFDPNKSVRRVVPVAVKRGMD